MTAAVYDQLKEMFWDYNYPDSALDLYQFILGQKDIPYLNRSTVIARMLVYVRWYELIEIFSLPALKTLLNNNDIYQYIHDPSMRENYEYVRTVLNRIL